MFSNHMPKWIEFWNSKHARAQEVPKLIKIDNFVKNEIEFNYLLKWS